MNSQFLSLVKSQTQQNMVGFEWWEKKSLLSDILNVWNKFENLSFTYDEDKKIFLEFLMFLENTFSNQSEEIWEFLEYHLMKYTSFDKRVLYNPLELLDAILENDFFGKKIDTDEVEQIISNFHDYILYFSGEMEKKEFLEKKYGIEIIFIEEEIYSIWAGIFGKSISRSLSQIDIIKKIEKLLSVYPISFIKNIQLHHIIIAQSFYKKDLYGNENYLWWFETDSDNNIYLTLSNIQNVFHHELYHQAMQYYNDRKEWRKLRWKQDLFYLYADIEKNTLWFARNYGKENISEDQATIAEALIGDYKSILQRCQTDQVLEKKVDLVKKAFLFLSDGIMDEIFWKKYEVIKK